jgi:putative endonuclease
MKRKPWLIYLLLLSDGSYYTGITTDIDKRMKAHASKRGSKYVYSRRPFELVFVAWGGKNRSWAQKMECKIKKMSHIDKKSLADFYSFFRDKQKI